MTRHYLKTGQAHYVLIPAHRICASATIQRSIARPRYPQIRSFLLLDFYNNDVRTYLLSVGFNGSLEQVSIARTFSVERIN